MKFINVTNHKLMRSQISDCEERGWEIIELPENLKEMWGNIPPDANKLDVINFVKPIVGFINETLKNGGYILLAGDFGATFAVYRGVNQGITALQSTMDRSASEIENKDGSVRTVHTLRHVRFREL